MSFFRRLSNLFSTRPSYSQTVQNRLMATCQPNAQVQREQERGTIAAEIRESSESYEASEALMELQRSPQRSQP